MQQQQQPRWERERCCISLTFLLPLVSSHLPFFKENKHYRVLIVLLFLFFLGLLSFVWKYLFVVWLFLNFYRHLIFWKILIISSSPPGKFDRKEVGFDSRDEYHPDMTDDSSACLNAHFLISIIFKNGPQRHKNLSRNKNLKFNIFIFISDDGRRIVRAG